MIYTISLKIFSRCHNTTFVLIRPFWPLMNSLLSWMWKHWIYPTSSQEWPWQQNGTFNWVCIGGTLLCCQVWQTMKPFHFFHHYSCQIISTIKKYDLSTQQTPANRHKKRSLNDPLVSESLASVITNQCTQRVNCYVVWCNWRDFIHSHILEICPLRGSTASNWGRSFTTINLSI